MYALESLPAEFWRYSSCMGKGAVVISILKRCDLCVCGSSPGPEASYIDEAAVSKVNSSVVVWNILKALPASWWSLLYRKQISRIVYY